MKLKSPWRPDASRQFCFEFESQMMKGFIKAKFHVTVGVDGQELMRRLKWLTNCREKKLPYIKCILGNTSTSCTYWHMSMVVWKWYTFTNLNMVEQFEQFSARKSMHSFACVTRWFYIIWNDMNNFSIILVIDSSW